MPVAIWRRTKVFFDYRTKNTYKVGTKPPLRGAATASNPASFSLYGVKIAVVCPYSLGYPGGVQSQVVGLTEEMRRLGHEVELLAPCDDVKPPYEMICLGPSLRLRANGSIAPTGLRTTTLAALRRELRRAKFDLVHLHEPLAPGPALVTLASVRVPVVGTFHRQGVSLPYLAWGRLLRPLADRLALRFAVSEDAARTASRVVGGEYRVVGNGVDLRRFAAEPSWPKSGRSVLFLGRHEHRKGLEVLLEAVPLVGSDVQFWIAGDGPQSPELHRRYAGLKNVHWLGRISDSEVALRLRAADVYVAPSLYGESFGVVLLEAMAASTAIIASDITGYRDVARDAKEALLVPPGDHRRLAESIDLVLSDPALAERLVAKGSVRAAEFSMEGLAKMYLSAFEEALSA